MDLGLGFLLYLNCFYKFKKIPSSLANTACFNFKIWAMFGPNIWENDAQNLKVLSKVQGATYHQINRQLSM